MWLTITRERECTFAKFAHTIQHAYLYLYTRLCVCVCAMSMRQLFGIVALLHNLHIKQRGKQTKNVLTYVAEGLMTKYPIIYICTYNIEMSLIRIYLSYCF